MTATGDNDGGIAVWPFAGGFVPVRPADVASGREHRVFTQPLAALLNELERAIRQEWFGEFRDEHMRDPGDILRSIDEVRKVGDGA